MANSTPSRMSALISTNSFILEKRNLKQFKRPLVEDRPSHTRASPTTISSLRASTSKGQCRKMQ